MRPSSTPCAGRGVRRTPRASAWSRRLEDRLEEVLDRGCPRAESITAGCRGSPTTIEPRASTWRGTIIVDGRLVDVVLLLVGPAELAAERHVVEPEHVEGGQGRGQERR